MILLLSLLFPSASAAEAPALVTLVRGDVDLVAATTADAPAPPFVLPAGAKLKLGAGAMAVVLYQGAATKVSGPATLGVSDLHTPTTGADGSAVGALQTLLARDASQDRPGASRTVGGLTLDRPLPGGAVLALGELRWRCDGCGPQDVQVYDYRDDKVLWTSHGEAHLAYAGPALAPGAYLLTVGGQDFAFTIAAKADGDQVRLAQSAAKAAVAGLQKQGVTDDSLLVSVPATVYLQAGLATDALYEIDRALAAHPQDAGLMGLRADFERRAGLAP